MVATSVDKYFDVCPLLRIRGDDRAAGAAKWMQQAMREEVAKKLAHMGQGRRLLFEP